MMKSIRSCVVVVAVCAFAAGAGAVEHLVGSLDELHRAVEAAKPGDRVVMADGQWKDVNIMFAAEGAAEQPITLAAQTPGGVTITGDSTLSISGKHLIVDGLRFEGVVPSHISHIVQFRGSRGDAEHCRLTNTTLVRCNPPDAKTRYFWASLYGHDNRIDRCRFDGMAHSGVTLCVWLDRGHTNHLIDHNHFVNRTPGDGNGFETIRIGTSDTSGHDAQVTVEHNLFERCDGEIEVISNKSNGNTFSHNTFLACAGTLTLRHGRRAQVVGNVFLGQNTPESGGVRVIGEDHLIADNYFADLDDRAEGVISITAGIRNTAANGYQQVKHATIARNTIVNAAGPAITFDWGHGQRNRTMLAERVSIIDNLIVSPDAPAFEGQEGEGWTWSGNHVVASELGIPPREGIELAAPGSAAGEAITPPKPLSAVEVGPAWWGGRE